MLVIGVYGMAGVGYAWALPGRWWQRLAMIVAWMPLIGYGMTCQFLDWRQRRKAGPWPKV